MRGDGCPKIERTHLVTVGGAAERRRRARPPGEPQPRGPRPARRRPPRCRRARGPRLRAAGRPPWRGCRAGRLSSSTSGPPAHRSGPGARVPGVQIRRRPSRLRPRAGLLPGPRPLSPREEVGLCPRLSLPQAMLDSPASSSPSPFPTSFLPPPLSPWLPSCLLSSVSSFCPLVVVLVPVLAPLVPVAAQLRLLLLSSPPSFPFLTTFFSPLSFLLLNRRVEH